MLAESGSGHALVMGRAAGMVAATSGVRPMEML